MVFTYAATIIWITNTRMLFEWREFFAVSCRSTICTAEVTTIITSITCTRICSTMMSNIAETSCPCCLWLFVFITRRVSGWRAYPNRSSWGTSTKIPLKAILLNSVKLKTTASGVLVTTPLTI